jgi:hypothetical protein
MAQNVNNLSYIGCLTVQPGRSQILLAGVDRLAASELVTISSTAEAGVFRSTDGSESSRRPQKSATDTSQTIAARCILNWPGNTVWKLWTNVTPLSRLIRSRSREIDGNGQCPSYWQY